MFSASTASSSSGSNRKEPRITVLFQHTDADLHCACVEALVASDDGTRLFTASRDSSVRRWDVRGSSGNGNGGADAAPAPAPKCTGAFEGHVDWVNGLADAGNGLLASCSSDRTVRLWRADSNTGECAHAFAGAHSDYVTRVAAAPALGLLASAGLRSEIVLYDLGAAKAVPLQPRGRGDGDGGGGGGGARENGPPPSDVVSHQQHSHHHHHNQQQQQQNYQHSNQQQQQQQQPAAGPKGSIYALAMAPDGRLLAAGTTESVVRLYDPRTHQKVGKLKGHTDNVRAVAISGAGPPLLLSASSDDTVRVWDLRALRCTQALALHTDSVWCLAAPPDFSVVYSGGRDGRVFRTHLARREAQLLARADGPVRALALSSGSGGSGGNSGGGNSGGPVLWASSAAPSVAAYRIADCPWPSEAAAAGLGGAAGARGSIPGGGVSRSFVGGSPALRVRASADLGSMSGEARAAAVAAMRLPFAPALVACRVLPDRRHILTADSGRGAAVWDVLSGAAVRRYAPDACGGGDLAALERALWRPVAVPAWFSADVRLGRLAVHLEPPQCFAAEAYALDLGVQGAADDAKINLGALLLRNALRHWARGLPGGPPADAAADADELPGAPEFAPSPAPPSVASRDARGLAWRAKFTALSGAAPGADALVPAWAAAAVLRNALPAVKELKAAFVLTPADGSGLPSLLQSRLNAPRVLQAKKVASYAASKLGELGHSFLPWEVPLPAPWAGGDAGGIGGADASAAAASTTTTHEQQQQQQQQEGVGSTDQQQQQQQYLELVCNGTAVPSALSVAAVKKLLWRRGDDVVFHYRPYDPARPAPMPKLGPE